MPVISGDLRLVTDRLDTVTSVSVRARETRAQGDGLTLGYNAPVPVDNGRVEFDALPGPAVMVLAHGGMATEAVPLLVPDVGAVSLADAARAATLADDATLGELEHLAAQAVADVTEVRRLRGEVREDAATATDAAGRAEGSATAASTAATDAAADRVQTGKDRAAAGSSADAAGQSEANAGQSATDAGKAAERSEQARDESEASAAAAKEDAGTALGAAADSAASAAAAAASETRAGDIAATGIPDATTTAKGKVRLAGDLGGTADAPTVPKLADKADKQAMDTALAGKADKQAMDAALVGKADTGHKHVMADVTDFPGLSQTIDSPGTVPTRGTGGSLAVPTTPTADAHAASKKYVDATVNARTPPAVVVTTVPATTVAGTIYYETG